jgi:hypothetical protein
VFGSPPASTGFRVTKRARWAAWVASATLQSASGSTLQMEPVDPLAYAITQARNTFADIAACFAWVLVTVLDSLTREEEPSLPVLPWPRQTSVPSLYSVMAITARAKCRKLDGVCHASRSGMRRPRARAIEARTGVKQGPGKMLRDATRDDGLGAPGRGERPRRAVPGCRRGCDAPQQPNCRKTGSSGHLSEPAHSQKKW